VPQVVRRLQAVRQRVHLRPLVPVRALAAPPRPHRLDEATNFASGKHQ
jgi:hypothetical protein